MGDAPAAMLKAHHLLGAVGPVASQRQIDGPGIGTDRAFDQGFISLGRVPPFKLQTEMSVRLGGSGQNHHAGRIHIEAMDDARFRKKRLSTAFDAVRQISSFAGHRKQPRRLLNDEQMLVDMQYRQLI